MVYKQNFKLRYVGPIKNMTAVINGEDVRFYVSACASYYLSLHHVFNEFGEIKSNLLFIASRLLGEVDENLHDILIMRINLVWLLLLIIDICIAKPLAKMAWIS